MQVKFQCPDELWAQFTSKAEQEQPGKTISEVLRSLLEQYVSGNTEDPLSLIMGADEAAKAWNFHPSTVKNFCAAGKLPARKFGKTWLIDKRAERPGKGDSNNAISESGEKPITTE